MEKFKKLIRSVRVKLFLLISIIILAIILFLIVVNNLIFATFYMYAKTNSLKVAYEDIQTCSSNLEDPSVETHLEEIATKNDFDIVIRSDKNTSLYTSNKDFFVTFNEINSITNGNYVGEGSRVLEKTDKYEILDVQDTRNGMDYILLSSELENGMSVHIRTPVSSIYESVNISNNFLYLMAGFAILLSAVIVTFVSRKFTDPILELNKIAKKMSNLDFTHKYQEGKIDDEINTLGKSINTMSQKLEGTIKQLRATNIELEKDIEEKSKIDEMRKSFISDVSHELKTPIALIQGYSEGLLENVNSDEESRKFYAEVILDETNKMDRLVKQLLELMKLEYGKREFNDKEFNIVELQKEIIRKSKVMLEEMQIVVKWDTSEEITVFADEFYIEQVITNYLTNAIKFAKNIDKKEKIIRITNTVDVKNNKVRIKVFNTGESIEEDKIIKLWNRFYKTDESRNRENGGTGIGLAFVKAIMNNYNNEYGVINIDDGVEFYFDLDMKI